jgi:hypothetical protein
MTGFVSSDPLDNLTNVLQRPLFIPANRPPTVNDLQPPGTRWLDGSASPRVIYSTTGAGIWSLENASTSALNTLTGNDSIVVSPVGGNISLLGTANQINVAGSAGTETFSLTGPYTPETFTAHGVLIGEGTSSVVATTPGTTGQVLIGASGADPAFGALGVNSGLTAHGVLIGEGDSAIVALAAGTTGQVLQSGGASANPAYSTATYPATTTINEIFYSSANNVVGQITTANNGVLITSASGVPSILADGTTGQILTATTGSPPSWVNPATSGTVTDVTGTANQVAVATGTTTPVISLIGPYTPATYTAHGVLIGEGTGSIVALADAATGTVLMGASGADPAFTGSPTFSGSVTATTSITATLGAITATNGNLVLGTAGNKILSTSVATTTTAGANSFGSVVLASGTATVDTTAVTASSLIVVWRQGVGASTALGELSVGTITASTSFVVYAATQGTPGTPLATDASLVGWMIIN